MPGDLHALLRRCRAEDAMAWEHFAAWVERRGRIVLRGMGGLGEADRQDAVAEALKNLVVAVRSGDIRGVSNGEIAAYVCTAIRHRALNLLRDRMRRRAIGDGAMAPSRRDAVEEAARGEAPDDAPAQDVRTILAERLDRVEKLLLSWPAVDRYVFLAKLNGVSAKVIQATLARPPFLAHTVATTVDTRFHRLRKRLIEDMIDP
jgi:DNA-directed RNA polymerase specialized sigma24 family protein